jgi:hypothetical protein
MNKNLLDPSPKMDDRLTLAQEIETVLRQGWTVNPGWQDVVDVLTRSAAALRQDSSGGVGETWEDAAQVCRYYLKHQNFEESEYAQGATIACENLEKIMLEKAAIAAAPQESRSEVLEHEQSAKELLAEVFDDRGCRVVNHDGSRIVTPEWVKRATDCICGKPR